MHAGLIAQALQMLAADPLRGVGPTARDLNVQQATMSLHIGPGGVCRQLDKLMEFPDYADHAESIRTSLRRLGHADQAEELLDASRGSKRLRPPGNSSAAARETTATARGTFSAQTLVSALSVIRRRQLATAEGRLDDPSLTQALHTSVGVAKGSLTNWVFSDGKLKKPATAIANMPGYAQERDEIRRLLVELGHAEAAQALPDGPVGRQQLGAKTIALALEMMAENPQRQRGEIALQVGVTLPTLLPYIGTKDANLEKIAALPGYATHVDSIRQSLQRMGRQDQAALLPRPQMTAPVEGSTSTGMSAQQLVDRANATLDKVVAVAELLRQDRPMTMWAATDSVGASKRVIRALLDERGAVRDRRDIEPALTDIDAAASRSLDTLLARLSERLDPTQPAAADEPPLKRLLLRAAGTASDRVLLVDRQTMDPGAGTRGRREAIYSQNPSLVHEPRSYAHDRQRQPLRWLSTMLRQQFPRTMEIQCYYDRAQRAIVVSGNATQVNVQIRDFVASGGMQRMLAEEAPQTLPSDAGRAERHRAKLLGRLNPGADPHPTPGSDEIFAAMAEGRFVVPMNSFRDTGTSVDVHAERRIADHLRAPVDRTQLAGTMRPCGTCADQIGAEPAEHRGPFWLSKAGRAGIDGDADIDRQARSGFGTSVTRARDGRLTFSHDTDSDSDA